MTTPVTTSVNFPFSNKGVGGGSLSLENDPAAFVGFDGVALILTDNISHGSLQLLATVGSVQIINTSTKHIKASYTTISGQQTYSLPYPGVSVEIVLAFNAEEAPIPYPGVGITYSADQKTAIFSVPFYGIIKVGEYDQPVSVLKYFPLIESLGAGTKVTYGRVAAYKAGQLAVVEPQPFNVKNGEDEFEIYRVESKGLINDKGAWEYPNGWPNNPSYPNGAEAPKPRVGVVTTRVHEIGLIAASGYFYSRAYDVPVNRPYFGDSAYQPVKEVVKGNGLSKLPMDLQLKAQQIIQQRGKGSYL